MRPIPLVAVALAVVSAGCLGQGALGPSGNETPTGDDPSKAPGEDDPVARPHVHDRWDGAEQVAVVSGVVATGDARDLDPNGSLLGQAIGGVLGSKTVTFRPDAGEIVPPGTGNVTVEATWEDPAPPGATTEVTLSYMPADATRWTALSTETGSGTWTIETTVEMADGGHAQGSLWRFALTVCRRQPDGTCSPPWTQPSMEIEVDVTALRDEGPLPREPPHPDWWANGSIRHVHADGATAEAVGAGIYNVGTDGTFFPMAAFVNGTQHDLVPPETRLLVVEFNWTDDSPTADALGVRPWVIWTNGGEPFQQMSPRSRETGHWVFALPIASEMTDGMYADRSRWRFGYGMFGQDTGVDEPLFNTPVNAPYHFDGEWDVTFRAVNSTELPARLG